MSWRSDELRHRSAERSGWVAELRAADPEDVDETVDGAVAYASETGSGSAGDTGSPERSRQVVDPTTVAGEVETDELLGSENAVADGSDGEDETARRRCSFCAGDLAEGEALDAAGVPFPEGDEFEWVGDAPRYHRECVPEGEGRFLPWTANGVLGDEAAE